MKEAKKHMEAYIAANKGSTDPATKAQVAQMEASLQMLAAMGIHKKREEEKRQHVSEMGSLIVTGTNSCRIKTETAKKCKV